MNQRTLYIIIAVVVVLILAYALGLFGGTDTTEPVAGPTTTAPTTTAPATGTGH